MNLLTLHNPGIPSCWYILMNACNKDLSLTSSRPVWSLTLSTSVGLAIELATTPAK